MKEFKILNDYKTLPSINDLPVPSKELLYSSYVIGNLTLGNLYTCMFDQKENKYEWTYKRLIMSCDPIEQRLNFENDKLSFYARKINELKLSNPELEVSILSDLRDGLSLKDLYEKYIT